MSFYLIVRNLQSQISKVTTQCRLVFYFCWGHLCRWKDVPRKTTGKNTALVPIPVHDPSPTDAAWHGDVFPDVFKLLLFLFLIFLLPVVPAHEGGGAPRARGTGVPSSHTPAVKDKVTNIQAFCLDVFPQLWPTQVGETLSFSKKSLSFSKNSLILFKRMENVSKIPWIFSILSFF